MSNLKFTILPLQQNALTPFVKRICYIENETSDPQLHPITPSDTIRLTFFFGDLMRTLSDQKDEVLSKRAYVLGVTTKEGVSMVHQGSIKQISIEFTPTGFYRLFHKHGCKFTDNPPADFSIIGAQILEDQLENCPRNVNNIQEVFEDYLLSIIPNALPKISLIDTVIEFMQTDILGKRSVNNLCEKVGVHQKYLLRLFKKIIGISPKQYYKTLQWNTIMSIINQNKEESLTRIALECGFYDHPSFTKEFKKFMGVSPSKFINNDVQLAELALKRKSQ